MSGKPPPLNGTEWMEWDKHDAIPHQRTLHLSLDEGWSIRTEPIVGCDGMTRYIALTCRRFSHESHLNPLA